MFWRILKICFSKLYYSSSPLVNGNICISSTVIKIIWSWFDCCYSELVFHLDLFYYPSYLNETKYVAWSKNIQMNEKEWMKKIQDISILMIFIQIKSFRFSECIIAGIFTYSIMYTCRLCIHLQGNVMLHVQQFRL